MPPSAPFCKHARAKLPEMVQHVASSEPNLPDTATQISVPASWGLSSLQVWSILPQAVLPL